MFDQPLRLRPIYQTRVWGARRLESAFHRTLPDPHQPYGESWEVCDRDQEQTQTYPTEKQPSLTLHELWTQHRKDVFGSGLLHSTAPRYPLLMKILDASDILSLQVHPPATIASDLGGEPKTEMWYVFHAEPGAKIYAGCQPGTTAQSFADALQNGSVESEICTLYPKAGDCLFIPSGMLHAIGAGLIIFEIQQNSDTTYRVYDWNRVGLDGRPRELHLAESLKSIQFDLPTPSLVSQEDTGDLLQCEYFHIRQHRLAPGESCILGNPDENLTLAIVQGQIQVGEQILRPGDFSIVPASLTHAQRSARVMKEACTWLEIQIPT